MAGTALEPSVPDAPSGGLDEVSPGGPAHAGEFPPRETLHGWVSTPYDREFIDLEFSCGLEYYVRRLDILAFRGEHVLDAGCGMGQWTLALGKRFRRVTGIDVNSSRLDFARRLLDECGATSAELKEASLEQLPFPDRTFDHIFCYGVIMFTSVKNSLSEFRRILKPGGRIYCCLNGDGWSHFLIEERGASVPAIREAGLATLYNTYWRRALQQGLKRDLKSGLMRYSDLSASSSDLLGRLVKWWRTGSWKRGQFSPLEELTEDERFRFGQMTLHSTAAGRSLSDLVHEFLGPSYERRLETDTWTVATTASGPSRTVGAEAFLPDEVAALAMDVGLVDFEWGPEARLLVDWTLGIPEPKYQDSYKARPCVWEFTCSRSEAPDGAIDPHFHQELARLASRHSVYLGSNNHPVISSHAKGSFPPLLLLEAAGLAARLGGTGYLAGLVAQITKDATSPEAAVRSIITFVQSALFRDPVSQPLTGDGNLPDALTILMCARGRCGHASAVLTELFQIAGLESRVRQLGRHVICEVKCGERWAIADADAFKHSVIPVNRNGELLSLADLEENPYQLDRFPATGWILPPRSRFTRDVLGREVSGYIDALKPAERGYVSGFFMPRAQGFPPSVPRIESIARHGAKVALSWSASTCRGDQVRVYRVSLTDRPRGWTYDTTFDSPAVVGAQPGFLLSVDARTTEVELTVPAETREIFAAVTAIGDRVALEPEAFFWPSEEVRVDS